MTIGTAIFSYNRSWCTKKSIEALHHCSVLPEKLFLFHDGIKNENDLEEWNKTEQIISEVKWCKKEIITLDTNKGLAQSIFDGVSYMLQSCDAVIIIEDDCIVHPQFMEFMIKALEQYKENKKVFSVSGYCEPVKIEKDEYDGYFSGRISSLGWGTWKDRWSGFGFDYEALRRIKKSSNLYEQLNTWGQDLPITIEGNVFGNTDSWAVFWALKCIEVGGYNLSPYESLVDNIGFDGSGVHSGTAKPKYILQEKEKYIECKFPDEPFYRDVAVNKLRLFYSRTSALDKERYYKSLLLSMYIQLRDGKRMEKWFKENNILSIAIWGKGTIANLFIDELKGKIDIECVMVTNVTEGDELYRELPLVSAENFDKKVDAILVIPGYDMDKISELCINNNINNRLISADSIFC